MKTIKIGRGKNNDVIIDDAVVSTSHAIISISDFGEISIEDLNSKNGTFVNGKRITKAVLTSSSIVVLGNHSIDWKQIIQTAKSKPSKPAKSPISLPYDVVEKKLIGRNHMSQIRYSFDDVSDKHAYICKKSNGDIVIIDNNSTNGTYVNGNKISIPYTLKKGDIINISNKHPLNWEAVYQIKNKPNVNYKTIISIVASMVLLIGLFLVKPWEKWGKKEWSEIYVEHKNDVVLIYVKSAYYATIQGLPLSTYLDGYDELDYTHLNSEGELSSGIAIGSGTGFFISKDGKFLTNRHVVGSSEYEKENEDFIKGVIQSILSQAGLNNLAANVDVKYTTLSVGIVQNDTYIDSEKDLIPSTIIKTSMIDELDVAILQTNSKSLPNGSTYVDLSKVVKSEDLTLGYEVCTIGFPKSFIIGQTSVGLEANNQSGSITQIRGEYEYGHNITIHQGASGSPVYDRKGQFAGIIVSGFLGISQGYNHAIHPAPIVEFVNKLY